MILFFLLFIAIGLVALALTLAAPPAAGWAAAELSRRLERPARVLVTTLAVIASSWWLLVLVASPRLAVCGAVVSWIGTLIAFTMAVTTAIQRRRARAWSTPLYPVMPPAWYAPTANPWSGVPAPKSSTESGSAAPRW